MTKCSRAVLALDLGTSSCKGALYSSDGQRLFTSVAPYEVRTPHPGYAEQAPQDYLDASRAVSRDLAERARSAALEIVAVGFSTQTPTLVFCDSDLKPVHPAIIWQDSRATLEAEWLTAEVPAPRRREWFGMELPLSAASTPAKLLWMKRRQSEAWSRTRWVFQPKDFLAAALTGQPATDAWCAKGLAHVGTGAVAPEWKALLGTAEPLCPPVREATARVGAVTRAAAAEWGIPEGTPVMTGCSDALAGILSTGASHRERRGFIITGTSEIVGVSRRDGQAHPGLFHVPGHLLTPGSLDLHFGPTQAGGAAVDWAARLMGKSSADLLAMLTTGSGPSLILFRPHLAGERAPYWDHSLTGSFEGLRLEHGPADVALAVVQGIALHEKLVLTCAEAAEPATEVILAGGGARHTSWNQLRANILQRPVLPMDDLEASLRGAALLAWAGLHELDLRNPPSSWFALQRLEPCSTWARTAPDLLQRFVLPNRAVI